MLLCICGAGESKLPSKSEFNLERDSHHLEEGTLSSCCSIKQRAMKLRLALDESRKTVDSSDVHLVLELQSFGS